MDLAELVGDPSARIADTRWYLDEPDRGRADSEAGHLPGAIHVHLEHHLSASSGPGRHPLPAPAAFASSSSCRRYRACLSEVRQQIEEQ